MIIANRLYDLPAWFRAEGVDNDIILSTRIRLARNLSSFRFPSLCSLFERKEVFDLVCGACGNAAPCGGFVARNFLGLEPVEQQFLVEERAASAELLDREGDRGIVGDAARHVSIMVNEEDHVRLTLMGPGSCAPELWTEADMIDTALGRNIEYAWDLKRGFLTCCPTNAGTGLRVSFLVHLVGLTLTKTLDQVLLGASQTGISTRGFFGEHSEVVGSFFQLSNQATMGASEIAFVDRTQAKIRQIVDLERRARDRILADAKHELEDKVFRAYGILRHARMLDDGEFVNLCSALRIGIFLGLFDAISIEELNRLTLSIMPAHLRKAHGGAAGDEQLRRLRAETVQAVLKQGTAP